MVPWSSGVFCQMAYNFGWVKLYIPCQHGKLDDQIKAHFLESGASKLKLGSFDGAVYYPSAGRHCQNCASAEE